MHPDYYAMFFDFGRDFFKKKISRQLYLWQESHGIGEKQILCKTRVSVVMFAPLSGHNVDRFRIVSLTIRHNGGAWKYSHGLITHYRKVALTSKLEADSQ
jgi:hypothetical protein